MRLALLAIFLTSAAGAQTASDDVTAYLTERRAEAKAREELHAAADDLMRAGAYNAAEATYRRAGYGQDASVALLGQGRFEEAMGPAPYQLDHLKYLAGAIDKFGREDLAVRVYSRALDADANRAEIYRALGDFYRVKTEWDLAAPAYQKALELDPRNRLAAFALADTLLAGGHKSEAAAEYRAILGVDPNDSAALTTEARVILGRNSRPMEGGRVGGLDLALDCIQRARSLSPNDPEILEVYGQVLVQKGLSGDAVPVFESLTAQAPRNPQYHFELAGALIELGNLAKAREELKTALDFAPEEIQPQIRILIAFVERQQ